MTEDEKPSEAAQRQPISPSVFDRVLQAGIDHANALDVDEPELSLPTDAAHRGPRPQNGELTE